MRGIHLYWKRKRSITWGMLHVSHILSHVKCTSVLKVDYVTLRVTVRLRVTSFWWRLEWMWERLDYWSGYCSKLKGCRGPSLCWRNSDSNRRNRLNQTVHNANWIKHIINQSKTVQKNITRYKNVLRAYYRAGVLKYTDL